MQEKINNEAAKLNSRRIVLYFAVALGASAVSFFLMASNSGNIYEATGRLEDRHYKLLSAASDLILLNSKLSMTANLAVVTGDASYERKYAGLAPQLDGAIKKLGQAAALEEGDYHTEEINEANLHLVEIARRALRLARSGKKLEASGLLTGDEYIKWKKVYAAGVGAMLRECDDSLLAEGAAARRGMMKRLVFSSCAVAVSLLLWALAAVSAARWLKLRGSTDLLLARKDAEFRHFFDTVQEIFYRTDWKGRITDITPSILKYSGFTREELLGTSTLSLYQNKQDRNQLIKELLLKGIIEDYEVKLRTKDRGILDVLVNARLLRGVGGLPVGIEGSLRVITARKSAEDQLRRMNRLYIILSRVNEAMFHIRGVQQFYEEVCRVAVEDGGMKFAWVGLPGPDGRIIPMASSGAADGYLNEVLVSSDASVLEGRGPGGSAAREGKVFINSDTETIPGMLPWRAAALKRGFRSSAVFPIGGGGIVAFYAAEKGFFIKEEEQLLSSIGGIITYAVSSLRDAPGGASGTV
jgi:PAS domain S-box-containing protein